MNARQYIVDASVFVADARPSEMHHTSAYGLLAHIVKENWQIYTPAIMPAEVAAAISRGAGDPLLAKRLVALLEQLPHVNIVEITSALGNLAADFAAQHRIRGCDAVYVALAQQQNCVLITLDQQQKDRVPSTVTARTPAEEIAILAI